MLNYLSLILICQLIGEFVVKSLGISIPGPVLGMVLLFSFLMIHGSVPEELGKLTDTLLNYLALLFVPAGVGVMLHFTLLGDYWLPVAAVLLLSTALTILATGLTMRLLDKANR